MLARSLVQVTGCSCGFDYDAKANDGNADLSISRQDLVQGDCPLKADYRDHGIKLGDG